MLKTYSEGIPSMTTRLDITILHDSAQPAEAHRFIQTGFAEANRLIGLISAWQPGTELYEVNQQAGVRPVTVGHELFYLLRRSLKISALTSGLFDVTFASIDSVWYFDQPMTALPDAAQVAHSIRNIDYRFIELDEQRKTVFITNKGTKIELGAIGKGFIANKIKLKLQALGVSSGLVNAGGDLVTWGPGPHGETWKIGISDPHKTEKYIAWLPLRDAAVATSGSYERFALLNGQKYSHILHPRTGWPVRGLQSVTVLSPDAELCDAIATSVFLLGKDEGLALVNQFDDLRCFLIDDEGQYHYSDNLPEKIYVETA